MANGYVHRGSVLGPLVLIAIGVVFLLRNHIPGFDAWQFVAHYWPALLIVWGLVRLAEHYSGPPGRYRGLGAGEVVLLVCLVIAGLGFSAIWHARDSDWGRQLGVEFWDPFQHDYSFSARAQAALPPGSSVLVVSARGDVELVPGASGVVAATLEDDVRGDSEAGAQGRFERSRPLLRVENGQLVVHPAGLNPDPRVAADLQLAVPPMVAVVVRTDHGDLRASGWRAPLDLSTGRGDLTVSDVKAAVLAHVEHGDVTVQNVAGRLQLDGNGGDVTLAQISGPVTVNGDFSGEIDLSGLPAGAQFTSSRTQLRLGSLAGSLTMDRGDLEAHQARDLEVWTRDQDVSLDRFTGALHINDSHATIAAACASPPRDPVSISDRDGDITLSLAADSQFRLDAVAEQGSIGGDFGVPVASNGDRAQAQTQIGAAGPAITLRTTNGSITLRKLGLKAASGSFR